MNMFLEQGEKNINVLECGGFPPVGGYRGGVATFVNDYFSHRNMFCSYGVEIELVNLTDACKGENKLLNLFSEKRYLQKVSKEKRFSILHYHVSRRWTFLEALLLIFFCRKKLKRKDVVFTVHSCDRTLIFFNNPIAKRLEGALLKKNVDKIIVLSEDTKSFFVSFGFDEKRILVQKTFHSTFLQSIPMKPSNTDGIIRILYMGMCIKPKGFCDFINAIKLLPSSVKIKICGGNFDDESEISLHNALKLYSNVEYMGYVTGKEKQHILEQTDVLVLPSYSEGMPVVIMEALAYGCAIVATPVGAIPEIINNRVNGCLISPGDISALADSIVYLSDRDVLDDIQRRNFEESKKYFIGNHIKEVCDFFRT